MSVLLVTLHGETVIFRSMISSESPPKCSDAPQSPGEGQLERISIQSVSFTEEGVEKEDESAPAAPLTARAAVRLCRERLRENGEGLSLPFEQ